MHNNKKKISDESGGKSPDIGYPEQAPDILKTGAEVGYPPIPK